MGEPGRKLETLLMQAFLIQVLFSPAIPSMQPRETRGLTYTYGVVPRLLVLCNSIDANISGPQIERLLVDLNVIPTVVNASEFKQYIGVRVVLILGGPDAPEGVGGIAEEILGAADSTKVREKGSKILAVRRDIWTPGQLVLVVAGYNRTLTEESLRENYCKIVRLINTTLSTARMPLNGKAVWTWGSTVHLLGVDEVVRVCKRLNITCIFLLVKDVEGNVVYSIMESLLPEAHKSKIYVHAWIVCFEDHSCPSADPGNTEYREYLLGLIGNLTSTGFHGHYVDGVHLDYIRYWGNAYSRWRYVSEFLKDVSSLIKKLNPDVILSVASKAEDYRSMQGLANSALYYGQNYTDMAKYVDLFCPMTYHLDYGVPPRKVGVAAGWVKSLTGKPVFAGIQLHPSYGGEQPSKLEIMEAVESCFQLGVDGIALFELSYICQRLGEYLIIADYYNKPPG